MTTNITLNIWDKNSELKRISLENIDLNGKVELLKSEALRQFKNIDNNIVMIFCGHVLEEDQLLSYYGITSGVTIHVINKKSVEELPKPKVFSEGDVQQLVIAFKTFTLSAGYRAALQRLSRPEVLETIIAATPGLAQDPEAIAFIQDPELIIHMSDPDTVRRVAKKHPALIEAANYIAAHIHEEQANINTSQASTSTGYSYSLDALSDDEDMDSNSDTNRELNPLVRNTSYNAITSAQLAAAIANVTNTVFNTNSVGMPPPVNQNLQSTNSTANVITSEMFNSAIANAFATSVRNNDENTAATSNLPNENIETMTRQMQPQLQQMHEMGLNNDILNVRALIATNGDVQAAVELFFTGVLSD